MGGTSVHLTIISYPSRLQTIFEEVAFKANAGDGHEFARCGHSKHLKGAVEVALGKVTVLDLIGHGAPGKFLLGDAFLLQIGQEPPTEFKELDGLLAKDASIRLLGCNTGRGEVGGGMLQFISQTLGGREVFGAKCPLFPRDFGPQGVLSRIQESWLASSKDGISSEVVSRRDLAPEDEELARKWESALPPGYEAMGRGRPLAEEDFRLSLQDVVLIIAGEGRLVLIEDEAHSQPLVLEWSRLTPPPALDDLRTRLQGL